MRNQNAIMISLTKIALTAWRLNAIKESWDGDPALGQVHGRFDMCFIVLEPDIRLHVPRFYGFDSRAPTALIEVLDIQWLWLEQSWDVLNEPWLQHGQVGLPVLAIGILKIARGVAMSKSCLLKSGPSLALRMSWHTSHSRPLGSPEAVMQQQQLDFVHVQTAGHSFHHDNFLNSD